METKIERPKSKQHCILCFCSHFVFYLSNFSVVSKMNWMGHEYLIYYFPWKFEADLSFCPLNCKNKQLFIIAMILGSNLSLKNWHQKLHKYIFDINSNLSIYLFVYQSLLIKIVRQCFITKYNAEKTFCMKIFYIFNGHDNWFHLSFPLDINKYIFCVDMFMFFLSKICKFFMDAWMLHYDFYL